MDNFGMELLMQPMPSSQQWAETQLSVIEKMIHAYQEDLDPEHDIALLLTNFGQTLTLEVEAIAAVTPVMLAFRGKVSGKTSILLQHVSQLNFLLTTIEKPVDQPHRDIGFGAKWEE